LRGTELVWKALSATTPLGGPAFQRIDYDPLVAGEQGLTVRFAEQSTMPGAMGLTWNHGATDVQNTTCTPITSAETHIVANMGDSGGLVAVAWHEGGRIGYGSNPTGALSPFLQDNMSAWGTRKETGRDIDGRKMVEYLGPGVDLSKYAK
jgi:hypothetical protein